MQYSKHKKILLAISILALVLGISFFVLKQQAGNSGNELTLTPNIVLPDGADAGSFKQLSMSFAKDKDHVYYQGEIAPQFDSATFEVLGEGEVWVKDKNGVYYEIRYRYTEGHVVPYGPLEEADPATFERLHEAYSRDKNHVYMSNSLVEEADPATFEIIPGDPNNSFRWTRDKNHVFHSGRIVQGANLSTFRPLNYMLGTDGAHVFSGKYLIDVADPATFVMINDQWPSYARDKNHVYAASYNEENPIVVGADPATFEILGIGYARDKNHIYKDGKMLEGEDPATFTFE